MKINNYGDFEECRYLWELVDEMVDWLHRNKSRQLVLPTYCDDEYYLVNHENVDGGVPIVMHVKNGSTKEIAHPIGWENLKYELFEILVDDSNDCDGIEQGYL